MVMVYQDDVRMRRMRCKIMMHGRVTHARMKSASTPSSRMIIRMYEPVMQSLLI